MPDPASMRATAARLQFEGLELLSRLDAVVAACGPDAWEGPAARRFLDHLAAQRRWLVSAAEELGAVAARLRQQAAAADSVRRGPAWPVPTGYDPSPFDRSS